jgi:hypothetical protein
LMFRVSFLHSFLRSLYGEGFQKSWEHSSEISRKAAKRQAQRWRPLPSPLCHFQCGVRIASLVVMCWDQFLSVHMEN